MKSHAMTQGDLLYHGVHGLCRVDQLIKEKRTGKETLTYALVPKVPNRMKMRFVIAAEDLEASGFHTLVSIKDAEQILKYLRAGNIEAIPAGIGSQSWSLAQALLSFSQDRLKLKDQRKLQMLERSAKGLVGELAYVFKTTLKETVTRIRKNLESSSQINPQVLTALKNVCED